MADPPTPSRRTILAPVSGFWYPRARETTDGDVAPSPSRDRDTRAEPDRPESTRRGRKAPLDTAESKLARRNRVLTPFTVGRQRRGLRRRDA